MVYKKMFRKRSQRHILSMAFCQTRRAALFFQNRAARRVSISFTHLTHETSKTAYHLVGSNSKTVHAGAKNKDKKTLGEAGRCNHHTSQSVQYIVTQHISKSIAHWSEQLKRHIGISASHPELQILVQCSIRSCDAAWQPRMTQQLNEPTRK